MNKQGIMGAVGYLIVGVLAVIVVASFLNSGVTNLTTITESFEATTNGTNWALQHDVFPASNTTFTVTKNGAVMHGYNFTSPNIIRFLGGDTTRWEATTSANVTYTYKSSSYFDNATGRTLLNFIPVAIVVGLLAVAFMYFKK